MSGVLATAGDGARMKVLAMTIFAAGVGPVVVPWDRIKLGDKALGVHTNYYGWGVLKARVFVDESTPLPYCGKSILHIKEATSEIFLSFRKSLELAPASAD